VQVGGDYVESWQPHPMRRRAAALRADRQGITDDLGGQGLFGVELFVKGDRSGSARSARARTTPAW
jgi:phosphoribosylglycinamide formyltransferase 2